MEVAFGMKAHSGWAALVVIGKRNDECVVVDRRRIELVEEAWARQPYHAAEELTKEAALEVVKRGVEAAHRVAGREMRAAVKRERERGNDVTACAVLVGNSMPDWSVEEILSVHLRMHQAEGVLFRDALVDAAQVCGLRLVPIPEKELTHHAEQALHASTVSLTKKIVTLGKTVGPPWGKDQKNAALAALVAIQERR